MTNCRITDLRDREVINICDGRRLGFVCDVEINVCDGRVIALIVPGECRLFSLGGSGGLRIPWDKIERIGEETILVCCAELPPPHDKKRGGAK